LKTKIGFLTIGMAPRPELVNWVPDEFTVLENGVLNEIPQNRWCDFYPDQGDDLLYTKARDQEIKISAKKIEPCLEQAGASLIARGAQILVVLCSAPLPRFKSKVPLLLPHNLIRSLIDRMLPWGTMGLLAPDPRQENMMRANWETEGRKIIFTSHLPYSREELLPDQLNLLKKCDLILADCFGYDVSFRVSFQGQITAPVLLVREVTMVFLQQLQGFKRKNNY